MRISRCHLGHSIIYDTVSNKSWGVDIRTHTIVTVIESDSKTDPAQPNTGDRAAKLRSQQERQGMAYILCRQATSLLQRTRLNVTIACEAWHAKHARHMLLGSHLSVQSGRALTRLRRTDIVDHIDPVMLIVGSRGLGHIKGYDFPSWI